MKYLVMKKWVVILICIIFLSNNLFAQDLNLDDVKKVANNFLTSSSKLKNYNEKQEIIFFSEKDTNLLYLIHDNDNFVIIANDLRVQPILGYTDEGSYDPYNIPPQLLELIESYKYEILSLKRGKSTYKRLYKEDWENYLAGEFKTQKASVAPFIDVNWDQGNGWNRFCPEDPDGPGGRVYAGCVAVSMAQSMSVFKHPDIGVGESSYFADEYGTLTVIPGETEYNWDLMSDKASDDYNSLLLYHCAVTVEMNFGPDGSGAYTTDIANALKNYFDYSSEVYTANSTEDDAWVELLKSELNEGRPISYGATNESRDGGHAFNLDGYNSSDAFHVNWGYSGSSNGYFQITNLTVNGSTYTINAKAVLNIKPMDHSPKDLDLSNTEIKEKLPVGSFVSEIIVDDPDENDIFTYIIEGSGSIFGSGYCPFYIDGDTIKIAELIDYNDHNEVEIKLTVTDKDGSSYEEYFIIEILKENSPPTGITISNSTFDDTLSIGAFIATFTTIDPDEVDTFTYELETHTNPDLCKDNEKFTIVNDTLFTNFDFGESDENTCIINIKSTDHKGESITESFNLNINLLTSNNPLEYRNEVIEIYPNPVKEKLVLNSMEKNIRYVKVYNLIGSQVGIYENNHKQQEIELILYDYKNGYYLVQVEFEDGSYYTSKILKE